MLGVPSAPTRPQGTVLKRDKTLDPGSGACGLPCGGGHALLVMASSLRTLRSPIALQPLRSMEMACLH
jgi:hypothetical protein